MYDTINMKLKQEEVKGIDLLQEIPCRLSNTSEHYFNEGKSKAISGYLGNLKVSVTEYGIKINDNSLCKWYLGDNFQTLGRGDTKRAVEKLSDLLCLPIEKADILRIDLAQNIIMNHDLSIYYNHLGTMQYYSRLEQSTGLYYQNKKRQLVFYNKVADYKSKGLQIPDMYKNRQVLRYELRYKKAILKQFNLPELKAKTLYNEAFYMQIIDKWYHEYSNINKIRDAIKFDYSMIKTKRQYQLQSILYYVNMTGGELEAIKEVNEASKLGKLSKKQAYDLREQIKQACKSELFTCKSEVISELDKKIKESVRFYN
jgi:hypothetical protein